MDAAKRAAAEAAALLPAPGMRVGLGTGSTVAYLLPALARRGIECVYVATSPATELAARDLGLDVRPFDEIDHLDLAIDGADQVAPDWWLVKGGGGAHTREKVVAGAAERFVVIVSPDKLVEEIRSPIPLELLSFGLAATIAALGDVRVREGSISPDGGVIADWCEAAGSALSPRELAARLSAQPGVVDHGLFPPEMVSVVIVGGVEPDSTTIL
ncbi:MAG: ribose 5-phosphate isomerase A [Acidimicrobiales bacterium]